MRVPKDWQNGTFATIQTCCRSEFLSGNRVEDGFGYGSMPSSIRIEVKILLTAPCIRRRIEIQGGCDSRGCV